MNARKKLSFKDAWQRVRTVPGLGRDVSALVVAAVLGFTAAGIILSEMNFSWPWESEKATFQAEFDDAVAVSPSNGQEVRIAGVQVGEISEVEATKDNTSLVTISLDGDQKIYDNARAILRPKNPLNEMYVEVAPGGPPGHLLPPNGVIPDTQTERPIQPEEVLNHVDERVQQALTNLIGESDVALASAPRDLPGGLAATDSTLKKLEPVVGALNTRRQKIRKLITSVAQISSSVGRNDTRLARLVDSTQQTLGVLAKRDDRLGATLSQLPSFSSELKRAMTGTSELTREMNPALDNLKRSSRKLPDTLSRLRATTGALGDTVRAARPVVAKAGPVVNDLRPVVGHLDGTFGAVKPVTKNLRYATGQIAPWMYDLAAFVYNTNSIFSVSDANGGLVRGHFSIDLGNPTGTPKADASVTNTYRQGGSPLGPYPAPGEGG